MENDPAVNHDKQTLLLLLKFVVPMVGLFVAWVGFALFHDEPLDPDLEALCAQTLPLVPDKQNAAVGLQGLLAPSGADIIAYGRQMEDRYARRGVAPAQSSISTKANQELTFSEKPGDLDCLNWPESYAPGKECPSERRISALLKENSELLQRYWQITDLPEFQPQRINYSAQIFISINKLVAVEIAHDLHRGNAEMAYAKWKKNYIFLSRASRAEDTWVGKALVMVNEGISLNSLEWLLYKSPRLIDIHGEELLKLLAPEGVSRWNLDGVIRAENRVTESAFSGSDREFWMRPNFIRNRWYRALQAFLAAAKAPPAEREQKFLAVQRTHGDLEVWTWDYLRSPLNTAFVRNLLRGELKADELFQSMVKHDGKTRLLKLRILLAQNHIADSEIGPFLANQTDGQLRNPFTDKPMQWNETNKVIWFGKTEETVSFSQQVRLPGGTWIQEKEEECRMTD